MKYALIDSEIHIHHREGDTYWPLSLEEAQHVVDVMNRMAASSPFTATEKLGLALVEQTVDEYHL